MQITIPANSNLSINGLEGVTQSDIAFEVEAQSLDHLAELCHIAKLPVDLSYTEQGKTFYYGGSGKKLVKAASVAPVVAEAPKPTKAEKAAPKKAVAKKAPTKKGKK